MSEVVVQPNQPKLAINARKLQYESPNRALRGTRACFYALLQMSAPLVIGIGTMFGGSTLLYAQSPTVHISPVQEQNFRTFMAWVERDRVFARKTAFRNAVQNALNAAKANDLSAYPYWVAQVEMEFDNLSLKERLRLSKFIVDSLARPQPTKTERTTKVDRKGSCTANSPFTSCETLCTEGERPRCKAALFARCECLR